VVLEQVLEVLENAAQEPGWVPDFDDTVAALRAELEQPDQEPVAVREGVHEINGERGSSETTSVAFQYRREQVAKQMAGVYTAFGASHTGDADEALIQRCAPARQEGRMEFFNVKETVCHTCGSTNGAHSHDCPMAKAALTQQEPVAWGCFKNGVLNTELVGTEADVDFWCASDESEMLGMVKGPIYTSPPRRKWKGLTDEELDAAMDYWSTDKNSSYGGAYAADSEYVSMKDTWRYIEQMLREKNNT
jgi:hypothetical protein